MYLPGLGRFATPLTCHELTAPELACSRACPSSELTTPEFANSRVCPSSIFVPSALVASILVAIGVTAAVP